MNISVTGIEPIQDNSNTTVGGTSNTIKGTSINDAGNYVKVRLEETIIRNGRRTFTGREETFGKVEKRTRKNEIKEK